MGSPDIHESVEYLEGLELKNLAPYALKSKERRESLGDRFREYPETAPLEHRTEYHRDRDRIVWSRPFKRLQHKTQVFPHYVEDHYRRRLTHALEVWQIATTLARALNLNEVVTGAIALGHDLGHPPFGHAGEKGLDKILRSRADDFPGQATDYPIPIFAFDHCVHGIEVVSRIERDYRGDGSGYYGLNLTFDVRDGMLKHMHDRAPTEDRPLSSIEKVAEFSAFRQFGNDNGSLEAQCVYFADKIVYLLADTEDGIRRGTFDCQKLCRDQFIEHVWAEHKRRREADLPESPTLKNVDDFLFYRRKALTAIILNCIDTTQNRIQDCNITSVDDVFDGEKRIVGVDSELVKCWKEFYEEWMREGLYVNEDVEACTFKAKKIVNDLFGAYLDDECLINGPYRDHAAKSYDLLGISDNKILRLLTCRNYIAGMTDPFAINQHARLFMSSERIRFT